MGGAQSGGIVGRHGGRGKRKFRAGIIHCKRGRSGMIAVAALLPEQTNAKREEQQTADQDRAVLTLNTGSRGGFAVHRVRHPSFSHLFATNAPYQDKRVRSIENLSSLYITITTQWLRQECRSHCVGQTMPLSALFEWAAVVVRHNVGDRRVEQRRAIRTAVGHCDRHLAPRNSIPSQRLT